jgi:hypothetical protein
MAWISVAHLLASGAEGLAGAASGPDWLVVGPSTKSKSIAPAGNSGEEVMLGVSI